MTALPTTEEATERTPRPQRSRRVLRLLLVIVIPLVGTGAYWMTCHIRQRQQQSVVDQLAAGKPEASWDHQEYVYALTLRAGSAIPNGNLALLAEFPRLRILAVYSLSVADDALEHIACVPGLEDLTLSAQPDPRFSAAEGIAHVDNRPLVLTDIGLQRLSSLRNLKHLTLLEAELSDQQMKQIARLQDLESLLVPESRLSRIGLRELAKLSRLRRLLLGTTETVDVADQELPRLLPTCEWSVKCHSNNRVSGQKAAGPGS